MSIAYAPITIEETATLNLEALASLPIDFTGDTNKGFTRTISVLSSTKTVDILERTRTVDIEA